MLGRDCRNGMVGDARGGDGWTGFVTARCTLALRAAENVKYGTHED